MIFSDFTIFAAAYISNTPHLAFSALIEQGARDNVDITSNNDKLLGQLSPLREETAITEQLKQNKHNFDVNLEQSGAEDVGIFSFFDSFCSCRNLKVTQIALSYHYGPTEFVYNSKEDTLLSALNFYNIGNLNKLYTRDISSFFEVKTSLLVDDKMSQETIEIHERERGQTIKAEYLPLSQEEPEGAFTHKVSSVHDAFATESSSSLGKQYE